MLFKFRMVQLKGFFLAAISNVSTFKFRMVQLKVDIVQLSDDTFSGLNSVWCN